MKMYARLLMGAFSFCLFAGHKGQQTAKVSGITFTHEVIGNRLHCTLEAPTNGWVGVGFNHKNSIVESDLLLFNIVQGKPSGTDLYVKSFGNPVRDIDNGGKNNIHLVGGTESDSSTKVVFSIPMDSKDANDFIHVPGKKAWLILAYSVDDDFGHHSRVRKHIPFGINAN